MNGFGVSTWGFQHVSGEVRVIMDVVAFGGRRQGELHQHPPALLM